MSPGESKNKNMVIFIIILAVVVVGIGFVLFQETQKAKEAPTNSNIAEELTPRAPIATPSNTNNANVIQTESEKDSIADKSPNSVKELPVVN